MHSPDNVEKACLSFFLVSQTFLGSQKLGSQKGELTFVLKSLTSPCTGLENNENGLDPDPVLLSADPPSVQRDSVLIPDNQPGLLLCTVWWLVFVAATWVDRLERRRCSCIVTEVRVQRWFGRQLGEGGESTEPPSGFASGPLLPRAGWGGRGQGEGDSLGCCHRAPWTEEEHVADCFSTVHFLSGPPPEGPRWGSCLPFRSSLPPFSFLEPPLPLGAWARWLGQGAYLAQLPLSCRISCHSCPGLYSCARESCTSDAHRWGPTVISQGHPWATSRRYRLLKCQEAWGSFCKKQVSTSDHAVWSHVHIMMKWDSPGTGLSDTGTVLSPSFPLSSTSKNLVLFHPWIGWGYQNCSV